MIKLNEAYNLIKSEVKAGDPCRVSTLKALNCIISENITAPINVPEFPCSIMDGVALRAADLTGDGPWRFPLQMTIAAGDFSEQKLLPGHAVKIMTGAPIIPGADTVIAVEEVTIEGSNVTINKLPATGQFTRAIGDDIKKGERVISKGQILGPIDIGILSALGLQDVRVIPKPGIELYSTGSEIRGPGERLKTGQIYDSNDMMLRALLLRGGFEVKNRRGVVKDDKEAILKLLEQAFSDSDLVITTGGVSMGDYDYIPECAKRLNGRAIFHKVFIKPGKPVFVAQIGEGWIVGLPGNPVSAVVGYHLFIKRMLARLMGKYYSPRSSTAILACDLPVAGDRFCLVGARFESTDDGIVAHPSLRQMSGRVSSIQGIDGFIFLDGGTRTVSKDTEVYIEWL